MVPGLIQPIHQLLNIHLVMLLGTALLSFGVSMAVGVQPYGVDAIVVARSL
jgi:hypothetical protein